MERQQKISRRVFFKRLGAVAILILSLSWLDMTKKMKKTLGTETITINPSSIQNGVNFIANIIIIKKDNLINVYSAKCPHLGCIINHLEEEKIICPCHGSQFGLDGTNLKGPALTSLTKLEYKFDKNKNLIIKKNIK